MCNKISGDLQRHRHSILKSVSDMVSVCVVTFPLGEAGRTPLSNLTNLLSEIVDRVIVISGGPALSNLRPKERVQTMSVFHNVSSKLLIRIISYVHTELRVLCYTIVVSRRTSLFVFFIGGESLFIPILALKLLRKKVALMPAGVSAKVYSAKNDPLHEVLSLLIPANFSIVDRLILYSRLLEQELGLVKYQHKTIVAHEHFVDFNKFNVSKEIDDRFELVGYIGRFSKEKGILNLIEAIPLVLKEKPNVRFIICGEGSLTLAVESSIKEKGLEGHVKLRHWITHEDVPEYLNEIRLLVLPSFTEGLPNIILEAMACGTPVLATSVGVIPDLIKDSENGFLLKSNNSKQISESIIVALRNLELLKEISTNSRAWVKQHFSKEETVQTWRRLLNVLGVLKSVD
jgi:glycosyltransferase involved in cell wall biosynthesis